MKYAILGDIHGNVEALQAVLADAVEQGVGHYACVGDLVGYNANPVECLETIRKLTPSIVRGNHDHYCSMDEKLESFQPLAADAVGWTRKQLDEGQKLFLRNLPFVMKVEAFTLVHSTLDMPEMWGYVFDKFEAEANFNYQTTAICFFGHTHVPLAFEKSSSVRGGTYQRLRIAPGRKFFINVGSVGQPRDGNPQAAYAVYNLVEGWVELRRVSYDIKGAQRRILAAGLPERAALRLEVGR